MDQHAAEQMLENAELLPIFEGKAGQLKTLERQFLEHDIPVLLGAKPKDDCCGGSCGSGGGGCGEKFQLLAREVDVARIQQLMANEWLEAVRREGLGGEMKLVPLGVPAPEASGALACPACGCAAELVQGACSDCGLQLE